MCEWAQGLTLTKMWTEISSSVPHFLKILMSSGTKKGTQICYPFPSKSPGKWIPSRFPNGAPMERDTRLRGTFTSHLIYLFLLKMFFWVFPRRQIVVGRRFGTLYLFHLQRLVVYCEVWEEARCNIYPARVVNWGWPDQWGSKATSSGQFKVGRSGWRGGIKEVCQVAVGLLCVVCLSRQLPATG